MKGFPFGVTFYDDEELMEATYKVDSIETLDRLILHCQACREWYTHPPEVPFALNTNDEEGNSEAEVSRPWKFNPPHGRRAIDHELRVLDRSNTGAMRIETLERAMINDGWRTESDTERKRYKIIQRLTYQKAYKDLLAKDGDMIRITAAGRQYIHNIDGQGHKSLEQLADDIPALEAPSMAS